MKNYWNATTVFVIMAITSLAWADQAQSYRIIQQNATQIMTVVTDNNPILLTGTDVLVINNMDYTIKNDIILRGDSQLIITNSKFTHLNDYSFQYWLKAYDNAKVIVRDSTIVSSPWLNWQFFNFSSLELTNVINDQSNVWLGLQNNASAIVKGASRFHGTIGGAASLYVENVPKTFIETVFPANAVVDEQFPSVVSGKKVYSFPNINDIGLQIRLTVKNSGSTYSNWAITYVPTDNVTIRNTTGLTVTFSIPSTYSGMTVQFSSLRSGYYPNQSWSTGNATLKLMKTTVSKWSPIVGGNNTLILHDCDLADNSFSSGNAQVYVYNSTMSFIRGKDDVHMYLYDSSVSGDVVATMNSILELHSTTAAGQMIEQDYGQILILP
jgi:hypothetical protein